MATSGDSSGKNPTAGVLWAMATATAYSMSSVLAKDLLGGLAPSSLLFWRFGISAAGMWVALAVVMAGVVLTVRELFGGVGSVSGVGTALALLRAVLMAAFIMVSSHLMPGLDGVVNSAWTMPGALGAMVPLVLIHGLDAPHGPKRISEVLLLALVTGVVSTVCFFRAMRHIAPGVVAMIMTLEVALAILWSVLFSGESVSAIKIIGAAVVVAGVLTAHWVNLRDARSEREVAPFTADLAV